jgi:death-on-curing protein
VLKLHDLIISETGGSHGLRDLGLLESALGQPQQTFGGDDLYPSLVAKASALGSR